MDTFNKYMVGMQAGKLAIINPPRGPIEQDDAIMFAAWIVALADPLGEKFPAALEAVTSS